jgi:hypothetical protein
MKNYIALLIFISINLLFAGRENGDIVFRSGKWASLIFDDVGHTGLYVVAEDKSEIVYHFFNDVPNPNGGYYNDGINKQPLSQEFIVYPDETYYGAKKDSRASKSQVIKNAIDVFNSPVGSKYKWPMSNTDNPYSEDYYKGYDSDGDGLPNIANCVIFTEAVYEKNGANGDPTPDEEERDGLWGLFPQEQYDSKSLTTT